VVFDPSALTGQARENWQKLLAAAESAKKALTADRDNGKPHNWKSDVWRGFKEFLFENVFFGMCAYCEAAVEAVYVGDAEHYRPKGKVTQRDAYGREVTVTCSDGNPHPGYYWLAYDWNNILPSCYKCNTSYGKGTQFPAMRHACSPLEVDGPDALDEFETPFLLQPLRKDYYAQKFLLFDDLGGVEAKNGHPWADASIKIYDLKRGALRDRRLEACRLAWNLFREARDEAVRTNRPLDNPLREYKEGRRPHSSAALQYVALMVERERQANVQGLESVRDA
jgi:hypothetical protein